MDRLESMLVLVTVADEGSLSAAARRLGMPVSTVSRKVNELESYLKTPLLIRTTRQITVTEAGQSYLVACRRILEEIGEAERIATGEYSAPKGELVITAPVVFGGLHVVPVVSEFLTRFPEIDIRLVLADRIAHLMEEHIDIAVRIGELPSSSLVATRVGLIRRVVCASPRYLKSHGCPNHPEELRNHKCVTFEAIGFANSWTFMEKERELSIPVHSRLVVNTAEAAIAAATLDVGLTRVLSYQIDEAIRKKYLQIVLDKYEPAPWPVSLIYKRQTPLPLKLRAFIDFVVPRLRERIVSN